MDDQFEGSNCCVRGKSDAGTITDPPSPQTQSLGGQ